LSETAVYLNNGSEIRWHREFAFIVTAPANDSGIGLDCAGVVIAGTYLRGNQSGWRRWIGVALVGNSPAHDCAVSLERAHVGATSAYLGN
jgi:hypothetical protein